VKLEFWTLLKKKPNGRKRGCREEKETETSTDQTMLYFAVIRVSCTLDRLRCKSCWGLGMRSFYGIGS
jgi:hypothetical protein